MSDKLLDACRDLWTAFVRAGHQPSFKFNESLDDMKRWLSDGPNMVYLERGQLERVRAHYAMMLGGLALLTGILPEQLDADGVLSFLVEKTRLARSTTPGQEGGK